jgi:hypothetical protein
MEVASPDNKNGLTTNEEIAGGLKNAVERGQDLEKAMRSFANAGYSIDEINIAAQRLSGIRPMVDTQQQTDETMTMPQTTTTTQNAPQPQTTGQPTTTQAPQPLPTSPTPTPKKSSKKLIIIMMIISALILVSAALLGLFWNQLFP